VVPVSIHGGQYWVMTGWAFDHALPPSGFACAETWTTFAGRLRNLSNAKVMLPNSSTSILTVASHALFTHE